MTDTKQPESLRKFQAIDFINTEEELEAYVSGRMLGLQAGYDAARLEISAQKAARIAYANEFPLNADGDPDVDNIHANIRALKRQLVKEAARTAEEKLRADRMTEQHRMQCQIREGLEREIEALRAAITTTAAVSPEGWPQASAADNAIGWTLDYKFLEKVEALAKTRTEYSTSMEATEQVLIAAMEVLAAAPKAEPVPTCEYPALPKPALPRGGFPDLFDADQMLAFVDADRAMRAQAAIDDLPKTQEELDFMLHVARSDGWHSALGKVAQAKERRAQAAPAAVAMQSKAVAYLDIGSGGYLDLGSDLDDEELLKLPSGRHMLAIVGTFGVDGYTPAAAPTTRAAPVAQGDALNNTVRVPLDSLHADAAYLIGRLQLDTMDGARVVEIIRERIEAAKAALAAQAQEAAPVAHGDALTYEQSYAIRQGHEIASSDAYFEARPQIDNNDRRGVFRAGFDRGWDAARAIEAAHGIGTEKGDSHG